MFLSSISQFGNIIKERQKPVDDIKSAISDYKEKSKENTYSSDSTYTKFSNNIKNGIDQLIATSVGEEKKLFKILKIYFKEADSINTEWTESYSELMKPRILNFNILNNKKECDYQISVLENYINKCKMHKEFVKNRIPSLNEKTKGLNKQSKTYIEFTRGLKKKDSLQKPIFEPYINTHRDYGQNLKTIIELLKKENGKWKVENEAVIFDKQNIQNQYDILLNNAIENEAKISLLADKLIDLM